MASGASREQWAGKSMKDSKEETMRAGKNFKIFVCEKQERGGGQGDYLGNGNVELENVLNEE